MFGQLNLCQTLHSQFQQTTFPQAQTWEWMWNLKQRNNLPKQKQSSAVSEVCSNAMRKSYFETILSAERLRRYLRETLTRRLSVWKADSDKLNVATSAKNWPVFLGIEIRDQLSSFAQMFTHVLMRGVG